MLVREKNKLQNICIIIYNVCKNLNSRLFLYVNIFTQNKQQKDAE